MEGAKEGRVWGSEELQCNAEKLEFLIPLVLRSTVEKAESKFVLMFCHFGRDPRPHYSQAV